MSIRTRATYRTQPGDHEPGGGVSRTRPNMTYTPKELLIRYSKGLPMDKLSHMTYHGDIYVPDPRTMDMTEISDAHELAKEKYTQSLAEYDKKEAARASANKKKLDNLIMRKASEIAQRNSEQQAK